MPTSSVLARARELAVAGTRASASWMIVSISAFSIPSALSWSRRQSGRSKAQTPAGSKERTSASAVSTSASFSSSACADLLARDAQVAVRVEVADQVARRSRARRGSPPTSRAARAGARKALRAREDVLERVLLALLLVLPRVVGRVQVVREVGVEVDLVERVAILLGGRGGVDRARAPPPAPGSTRCAPPARRRFLFLLLQDRVLDQLLGEDLLELEPRHLQQLDRLLQRRRHHQPLREPEVELLFQGHTRRPPLSGAEIPHRDRSFLRRRRSRVQGACRSAGSRRR